MIGTVIEKYEVLEKIGEGGMATVYRGRHTTLDRTVAIKLMHPHLSSSEKNRERFAREARAIETLRHDNILRIFDYSGPDSERCFIVTEYIQGPTLRALLDDVGAMMPEPAALVAQELCRALEMAHNQGIVHRDIKPENIMLDARGRVKLMDFGIARIADDSHVTMTGALVGSPAYMSPEQATGEEVDRRSDLFALGTVLYRMVTGTLPFRGGNPSVVLKNIIETTYDDPTERVPSLDPAVASIIARCLLREPGDRFEDAGQVREELEAFLRSVGIDPEEPTNWTLSRYLTDPEGYDEELQGWLVERLVGRGRSEAAEGRTAEALRTFNRVLTLDEENAEVVSIIEGMRPPLPDEEGRRGLWLWVAPLLIAVAVVAALALQTDGFRGSDPSDADNPVPRIRRVTVLPMPVVPYPESRPTPIEEVDETPEPATEPATPEAIAAVETPEPATEPATAEPTPEPTPDEPATPEPMAVFEGTGTLRLFSPDAYVTFRVDGGQPQQTPTTLELPAGDHIVYILGNQYAEPQELRVRVPPDKETTLPLKPVYRPSRVDFSGFPTGTVVLVDGAVKGTLPSLPGVPLTDLRIHTVTLRHANGEVLQEALIELSLEPGVGLLPGETRTIAFSGSSEAPQ